MPACLRSRHLEGWLVLSTRGFCFPGIARVLHACNHIPGSTHHLERCKRDDASAEAIGEPDRSCTGMDLLKPHKKLDFQVEHQPRAACPVCSGGSGGRQGEGSGGPKTQPLSAIASHNKNTCLHQCRHAWFYSKNCKWHNMKNTCLHHLATGSHRTSDRRGEGGENQPVRATTGPHSGPSTEGSGNHDDHQRSNNGHQESSSSEEGDPGSRSKSTESPSSPTLVGRCDVCVCGVHAHVSGSCVTRPATPPLVDHTYHQAIVFLEQNLSAATCFRSTEMASVDTHPEIHKPQ